MLNWVDVAAVIVIAFFVFNGSSRGLTRTLLDIFAVLIAIFAASELYKLMTQTFMPFLKTPDRIPYVLIFGLLWLGLFLALDLLVSALQKFVKISFLQIIDSLGGGVLGFIKGVLIVGVILQLSMIFPFSGDISSQIGNATATKLTLPTLRQTYSSMFGMFPKVDLFLQEKIIPAIPKQPPKK